jgi:PAS domain S-box-containing protein
VAGKTDEAAGSRADCESGYWPAGASLRADRSVGEAERNFRTAIERLPEGVAVHDGRRLVYVNPALASMLGYPEAAALVGMEWERFVDPKERGPASSNVAQALRLDTGTELVPTERRLIRRDQTAVCVELSAIPVTFDDAPALLVVARDLTLRKQLEQRAHEANRMAALGALAAGVAHEVNNPLAWVLGNLAYAQRQLARLRPEDPSLLSSLREALEEAYDGVERVRRIVTDLKTFSRAEERDERVDLRRVLKQAVKIASPQLRHLAKISDHHRPCPEVKASTGRLAQVFLNLLLNAADALHDQAPGKGEIATSIGTDAQGRAFAEVTDNGAGIPPEVLPRVTDPFFTTKPIGVGTGLGLTVCRNIVQGYGGELVIQSELGRGTTVRITLPKAPVDFVPRVSGTAMHAVHAKHYRILIIDDEPLVLRAMRRLLDAHSVVAVQKGEDALELLASGQVFDIILCDLMMPSMTGMEVYERLSALGKGLERRVVLVTGGAVTEESRDFLARVPNLCFEKPLDPRKVEAMLAQAVIAASE